MGADVVEVYCISDCKWPKFLVDDGWPVCHGMEYNCSGGGLNHPNGSFGNAILPMAADGT